MKEKLRLFDNTRLNDFRRSPRYAYYRHVRHWARAPRDTVSPFSALSPALVVGSAIHAAMDSIWTDLCASPSKELGKVDPEEVYLKAQEAFLHSWVDSGYPHPNELDPENLHELGARNPFNIIEMLSCYIESRQKLLSSLVLLEVEKPFLVPLDPNDPSTFYIGRRDKDCLYMGNRILGIDHKTTTSYTTLRVRGGRPVFKSGWLDSWHGHSQMDGYLYSLSHAYNKRIQGFWIDAILLHKDWHDVFDTVVIDRATELLDQWLWMTHYWIELWDANANALEDMRSSDKQTGYMTAFPCDGNTCSTFGGCPYRDICRMTANPEEFTEPPEGYVVNKWEPFDEEQVQKAYNDVREKLNV